MKLKVSLAGIAKIAEKVMAPIREAGARGVPNGFVEEKSRGYGRRPCLATSRIIRDCQSDILEFIMYFKNRAVAYLANCLDCLVR
jgi:hypothetical protein